MMKIFLTILVLVLVCATSGAKLRLSDAQRQKFANGLEKEIGRRLKGGRSDVIPDLPAKWDLPAATHTLQTKYGDGGYSYEKGCTIEGLHTLKDDIYINFLTMVANGTLILPSGTINGIVAADVNMLHPVTGVWTRLVSSGLTSGSVQDWTMTFNTRIKVDLPGDFIELYDFRASMNFGGLISIRTNQATWGGVAVDWNRVNAAIPEFLADLFNNHREEAIDVTLDIVNRLLKEWHLSAIIGSLQ